MRITWLGQACFVLQAANGTTVLCDPYDGNMGFPPRRVRADVVTISHEHHDHNCLDWVEGTPAVWRGVGIQEAHGVRAQGFASFHDDVGGAKRGPNTIFLLEVDGLRICHLGDLGHPLTPSLQQALARPDVLLLPVGGYYTIDHREAQAVQRALQPALTIPMHFQTGVGNAPIATVEPFAGLTGAESAHASMLEVAPGQYNGQTIILDYER